MPGEVAALTAEAAPFVTAYGAAVLRKTNDDLADGAVGLGKRLLQLIFRRGENDEQLPDIVVEAVEDPDDSVVRGMLEYTIRKALENDAQMLAEVREILAGAAPRVKITQNVRAGRNAYVVGQGDMNLTRSADLTDATGRLSLRAENERSAPMASRVAELLDKYLFGAMALGGSGSCPGPGMPG